jgi:hypothetical protein
MKHVLLTTAAILAFAAPLSMSHAADGTTPAHQVAGAGKSVRDMTPDERRAFWNSLSDEDKARILARRSHAKDQKSWDSMTPEQRAARTTHRRADTAGDPQDGMTPGRRQQLANGKAQWDAMTPDQKRAFLKDHAEEIRAAQDALQNGRAAQ